MSKLPFVDEWGALPNYWRASADVIMGWCKKVRGCGTETTDGVLHKALHVNFQSYIVR